MRSIRAASRDVVATCYRSNACPTRRSTSTLRAKLPLVRASVQGSQTEKKVEQKNIGFVADMRKVAMKLHTRDQAPKEGGKAASKAPMAAWVPTKEGYLTFLAQSKVVYDAFESIIASNDAYAAFRNNGLERSGALTTDLAWFKSEYGLEPKELTSDSAAAEYVDVITKLATEDPPAFICHFYNFYFAHTAGGRMIGKQMAAMLLNNKVLAHYEWEGDVAEHLDAVREEINRLAASWSAPQKEHCLAETAASFKYSGALMRSLAGDGH